MAACSGIESTSRQEHNARRSACFDQFMVVLTSGNSTEDSLHHLPMHVRQSVGSALEGVSKLFVIEAEQVQQRGVEVVDVDFVLDCFVAKIICLPITKTAFHTSPRDPDGESAGAVIAAGERIVLPLAIF